MGGVDLDDVEAGLLGPHRSRGERLDLFGDTLFAQGMRLRVIVAERERTRREDVVQPP